MDYNLKQLHNTLFIDIETISQFHNFKAVPDRIKPFWAKKAKSILKDFDENDPDALDESYKTKAAIYAEFGRIICISTGFLSKSGELRIKTITHEDEKILLSELKELLEKHYFDQNQHFICGHNVREFDIPYICRRMIINNISLPSIFNIMSKKPWQTEFILDTMDLWRFGDYKSYTSLDLLCALFDIESPKSNMDGSLVGKAYYEENRLNDILQYCARDVQSLVLVLLKLTQLMNAEEIKTEFLDFK
jgi:DNA polymerase elongation subunit (family B)